MKSLKRKWKLKGERARSARGQTFLHGSCENPINKVNADVETEFVGYTSTTANGKVVVIATDEDFVDELTTETKGYILTDKTPFYAEMGGQIGDTGMITGANGSAYVYNTKKNVGGKTVHYVEVKEGSIK